MSDAAPAPIMTLEPLIDAVRSGVENAAWDLSGLQKTTSHEFEGRWKGDSSRSAYLFFHGAGAPDWSSVDVFLDETSSGLSGNLALVVELRPLGELGEVAEVLTELRRLADQALPQGYRTPVTLRFRLEGTGSDPSTASTEARFKLRIPRVAIEAGSASVAALSSAAVQAFQALLDDPAVGRLCVEE